MRLRKLFTSLPRGPPLSRLRAVLGVQGGCRPRIPKQDNGPMLLKLWRKITRPS